MRLQQIALLALLLTIGSAVPIAAQVTPTQIILAQGQTAQGPANGATQEARIQPDDKCWTDWSEAAVIVRREALMPVERVSKLASAKYPGAAIMKVTLCEEQGKFVYHVLLRERQGQLKSELLDAK
jgi:uncharacterized membrane protein YkoI